MSTTRETNQTGPATDIRWMWIICASVLLYLAVFCLVVLRSLLFDLDSWNSPAFSYVDVLVLSFLISWRFLRKTASQFLLNATLIGLLVNVVWVAVGVLFLDVRTVVFAALPRGGVILLGCMAAGRLVSRRKAMGLVNIANQGGRSC